MECVWVCETSQPTTIKLESKTNKQETKRENKDNKREGPKGM